MTTNEEKMANALADLLAQWQDIPLEEVDPEVRSAVRWAREAMADQADPVAVAAEDPVSGTYEILVTGAGRTWAWTEDAMSHMGAIIQVAEKTGAGLHPPSTMLDAWDLEGTLLAVTARHDRADVRWAMVGTFPPGDRGTDHPGSLENPGTVPHIHGPDNLIDVMTVEHGRRLSDQVTGMDQRVEHAQSDAERAIVLGNANAGRIDGIGHQLDGAFTEYDDSLAGALNRIKDLEDWRESAIGALWHVPQLEQQVAGLRSHAIGVDQRAWQDYAATERAYLEAMAFIRASLQDVRDDIPEDRKSAFRMGLTAAIGTVEGLIAAHKRGLEPQDPS